MVERLSIFGWCHGTRSIAAAGLDGLALAVGSHLRVAEVSRVFPPVRPPAQRLLLPPKPAESDPLLTLLCRDLNAQKNYTELPRNVRIAVEMAFLEKKMSMATMTASL